MKLRFSSVVTPNSAKSPIFIKRNRFHSAGGKTVGEKTVPGHSPPRITQRLEPQFTSELMSVKDQE